MNHYLTLVGNRRRMARFFAVLLLLGVLGGAALLAVQAQGISMYVFFYGRGGGISEESRGARVQANRVSLGAGYGHEARFKLCFSGSATPGVDYYVSSNMGRFTLNEGCLSDYFASGQSREHYYIVPNNDSDDEPDETVTVTMLEDSGNPFPSSYYFMSHYARATYRIIDDD